MAALLDRLQRHPEIAWLACLAWAAQLAFLSDGTEFLEWPVMAVVGILAALIGFDHLYRFAPLRDALKAADDRSVPARPDKFLASLMFASAAGMIAGFWFFDLDPRTALPLFLSILLPSALKRRREEVAYMATREVAK